MRDPCRRSCAIVSRPDDGQPADLRRLIGEDRLFRLVSELAHEAHLSCPETCTGIQCPHLCPPTLVPLLVYCYAAGIYGSDEIEQGFDSNPNIRVLSGEKVLESVRIRCFRRSHRPMIQQGLRDLIRQARGLPIQHPELLADTRSELPSDRSGPWTCEEEAGLRIDRAVHADSMDSDA